MLLDSVTAREAGLLVFRSPDGAGRTRISVFSSVCSRTGAASLQIDVSEASLQDDLYARTPETWPIEIEPG